MTWKKIYTEAKLSSHHLGCRTKKSKRSKSWSIETNKASFETKTPQDIRIGNKHRKVMYPAVTKPKKSCQKPFNQTSEKLIKSPHPQI